jgi:AAA family ATP:ADP antiporter
VILRSDENRSAVLAATVTAASGIAFQVGSKATRDALFLSSFGVAALPAMIIATSILAIAFAFLSARALTAWGPGRVIPGAFAGSAVLLLVEWAISLWFPRAAAVLVYLHCGCLGGLLVSGFWSLINERFDPRTAKRHLGPISAWGTFGGVLGGLIAARVGQTEPITAMLPILAVFHFLAAAAVARVGLGSRPVLRAPRERNANDPGRRVRSGLTAVFASDYLRGLVGLVILVTVSEGFLDIVLKTRAASAFGGGGELLRFFAVFYTVVSVVTLLFQAAMSRVVLEKLGPARTAAVLPVGVTVATAGAFVGPGLWTAALARGAESILSNSLFRGGYEVLFTPVAALEKRSVKPLADVGAARVGDLISAAVAQGVLAVSLFHAPAILTALALVVSVAAAFAAFRLGGGYVRSLERGLRSRAIELDLSEVRDATTRVVMLRTLDPLEFSRILPAGRAAGPAAKGRPEAPHAERIGAFRSSDPEQVRKSLRSAPVTTALVPEVMSLLAWDDVAKDAIETLRGAGPTAIEPLIAGLLDPREEFAIRRRIPLILATYADPRALEGLSHGLGDRRFEVRYRCGRGLSHLTELDPSLTVASGIVTEAVLREVDAGAGIWEGRLLLDQFDDELWSPVVDDAIRARANKSLEHVFTLLALILPRQPLRIAFRGLHAEDAFLRGTALEYLESALPPEIRKPLWPYLEDRRPRRPQAARPTEEALARLIQSSESIVIHLDELRRKKPGV